MAFFYESEWTDLLQDKINIEYFELQSYFNHHKFKYGAAVALNGDLPI